MENPIVSGPLAADVTWTSSGICIELQGSGYRSALFHAGALLRLGEIGALKQVRYPDNIICPTALDFVISALMKDWSTFTAQDGGERGDEFVVGEVRRNFIQEIQKRARRTILHRWAIRTKETSRQTPTTLTIYKGISSSDTSRFQCPIQLELTADPCNILECCTFKNGESLPSVLSRLPDDTSPIDNLQQEYLVDWGYAVCEATVPDSIRSATKQSLPDASPNRLLYFKYPRPAAIEIGLVTEVLAEVSQPELKSQEKSEAAVA